MKTWMKWVLWIAFAVSFIGFVYCAHAAPAPVSPENQARATVHLIGSPAGACSAVVLKPGVLVTAAHCLDTKPIFVANGDMVARITKTIVPDIAKDYMIIYAPGVLCPCAKIMAEGFYTDETVMAVGYPYGHGTITGDPIVTKGEVEGLVWGSTVKPNSPEKPQVLILTTARVVGGMSGGGLFVVRNHEAELIGVITATDKELTSLSTEITLEHLEKY